MRIIFKHLTFILLLFCIKANAQMTVSGYPNAAALAQKIVGPGITVTNAQITNGSVGAAGIFSTANPANFPIASGIVLTSGSAANIPGAAGGGILSTALGNPGDPDLDILANTSTGDAFVLEFDFVPIGPELNVKFTFASEEYPNYNCCFNDPFGFFISSVTGSDYPTPTNIALVPGVAVPVGVSINSINSGVSGSGFGCSLSNCTSTGPGAPYTAYYVSNAGGTIVKYNGYTKNLFAKTAVIPCQTYHIKLAIADAGDDAYDSGVFIEEGSFKAEGSVNISNTGPISDGTTTTMIEGCKDGQLIIKRRDPATTNEFDVTLNFTGTASNTTDLVTPIPSTIHFSASDVEITLPVKAKIDALTEGSETFIVNLVIIDPCTLLPVPVSTTSFLINDNIVYNTTESALVCSIPGSPLTGPEESGEVNTWLWTPGNQATQNIMVNSPGVYIVDNTFLTNCHNIKTITVTDGDPTVSISSPVDYFCTLQSLELTAGGTATMFLWNTNETTPAIQATNGGTYTVKGMNANGCYLFASKTIVQKPLATFSLGPDVRICSYDRAIFDITQLNPTVTYEWYNWNHNLLSNLPTYTAYNKDTVIAITTLDGCPLSDTNFISQKIMPIANAGANDTILLLGSARLYAQTCACNASYAWAPDYFINNAAIYNPIVSPLQNTNYYLTVTSPDGCILKDTMTVFVTENVPPLPNVFSPNGDGINDYWDIGILRTFLNARLQVFNRFGQVVYTTNGYDNNWNGRFNGKPLPIGTYYYIFDPRNGKPIYKGNVTILK